MLQYFLVLVNLHTDKNPDDTYILTSRVDVWLGALCTIYTDLT